MTTTTTTQWKSPGQHRSWLQRQIETQRVWIDQHGGDLPGYVQRYGSVDDPNHAGNGGEAIYEADVAALRRLEADLQQLDEAEAEARAARARRRPHVKVRHGECGVCGHYGSDCTGTPVAQLLARLERKTRALLAEAGQLDHDSARFSEALGYLAQAADALQQAGKGRQ